MLLVTPNFVHCEQAVACADVARSLRRKAIADTLEDGLAMSVACEAAGVTCSSHGLRRLGADRAAERLVRDGALGQVVLAEATSRSPGR